jgi:hypothetical protein
MEKIEFNYPEAKRLITKRAHVFDLSNRWESEAAKETRKGTLAVRAALEAQWLNC